MKAASWALAALAIAACATNRAVTGSKVLQNTDVTRIEVNPATSAGLFDAPTPR